MDLRTQNVQCGIRKSDTIQLAYNAFAVSSLIALPDLLR